jgi:hypothetical protein
LAGQGGFEQNEEMFQQSEGIIAMNKAPAKGAEERRL